MEAIGSVAISCELCIHAGRIEIFKGGGHLCGVCDHSSVVTQQEFNLLAWVPARSSRGPYRCVVHAAQIAWMPLLGLEW